MATIRKKIVVVGDGNTGKTCMLIVFKGGSFLETHVPTVFESYVTSKKFDDTKVDVTLMDTAGQEEYDRIRPLTYPKTNSVVCVFSVADPVTLENIKTKWIVEIEHFLPNVPVLLVGNKTDLRNDPEILSSLASRGLKPVSQEEGSAVAKKIHAEYAECSAKLDQGIEEVFMRAVLMTLKTPEKEQKRRCRFL